MKDVPTERQSTLCKPKIKYNTELYNKFDNKEQWIRITEGCPNQCEYCYEPREFKVWGIPDIIRNDVKIMDMNLLAKPECRKIIADLGKKRVNGKVVYYELVCGIDYRFMNKYIAHDLKLARFRKIRLAWDWGLGEQYKIKESIKMLIRAGYNAKHITLFMICNWKIPYEDNMKKMDLCKVWNVKIADCYFDNQTSPNIQPVHWSSKNIKAFRVSCRKHNQLVGFGIDPEYGR